jgi:hypothetical protein
MIIIHKIQSTFESLGGPGLGGIGTYFLAGYTVTSAAISRPFLAGEG